MKIGIYGGTFNPIHNGHINIIKGFYEKLNLDKIIVIPTAQPPHKVSLDLASGEDRINMCKLALSCYNFCDISDIEIKRTGKSFTVDTLKSLKNEYPQDEFYLLMGEDMFLIIDKWRQCEEIFSLSKICLAPRSVGRINFLENFAKNIKNRFNNFEYELVDINYIEASSTQIRNGDMAVLPKSVKDYIEKNRIYI